VRKPISINLLYDTDGCIWRLRLNDSFTFSTL